MRLGIVPGVPMSMDVYCKLRHAIFRVVDEQPEPREHLIESLGHSQRIAMRAPSFAAVWQTVAANDLIGMIPQRLADMVAGPAELDVYPMAYALPPAEICQAWHRRNSSARGLIWLRSVIREILAEKEDNREYQSA